MLHFNRPSARARAFEASQHSARPHGKLARDLDIGDAISVSAGGFGDQIVRVDLVLTANDPEPGDETIVAVSDGVSDSRLAYFSSREPVVLYPAARIGQWS